MMQLEVDRTKLVYLLISVQILAALLLYGVLLSNDQVIIISMLIFIISLVFLMSPYQLLLLFILLIPFDGTIKLLIKSSFMSFYKELFVILILLKAFLKVLQEKRLREIIRRYRWYYMSIILFGLWGILALTWSYNYNILVSSASFIYYIRYMLVSIILTMISLDRTKLKTIVFTLSLGALSVSVLAIIEVTLGIKFSVFDNTGYYLMNSNVIRPYSSIGSSLGLGHYLGALTPVMLYYFYNSNGWKRIYGIWASLILAIAIILSTVRAAYIAFAIGFILCLFFYKSKNKIALLFVMVTMGMISLIQLSSSTEYLSSSAFFERISNLLSMGDSANSTRVGQWIKAIQYFFDKPVFGHGYGFGGNIPKLFGASGYIFIAESWPLKVVLEIGVIGLLLWYMPIVYTFVLVLKNRRMLLKEETLSVFFSLIILLINSLILQIFEVYIVDALLWIIIGILLSSKWIEENNKY